jgi:hypothetical protein
MDLERARALAWCNFAGHVRWSAPAATTFEPSMPSTTPSPATQVPHTRHGLAAQLTRDMDTLSGCPPMLGIGGETGQCRPSRHRCRLLLGRCL